jgi:hypothetical protein
MPTGKYRFIPDGYHVWRLLGREAQPKEEHPSTYEGSPMPLQGQEEKEIVFGPMDDISLDMPKCVKDRSLYTPRELSALREYVRRRMEGGHCYSERYMSPVSELAEQVGMPGRDLISLDEALTYPPRRGPRANPSIIGERL